MYYYPTPNNNRKATIVLIILIVVFILGCVFTIPAQVRKQWYNPFDKKVIVSYYPQNPLKFKSTDGDTIFLTMRVDSIGKNENRYKVMVRYPKSIKLDYPYVRLRMEFGKIQDYFYPSLVIQDDNEIEYSFTPEQLADLRYSELTWVSFEGVAQSAVITKRVFFSNFLSGYLY